MQFWYCFIHEPSVQEQLKVFGEGKISSGHTPGNLNKALSEIRIQMYKHLHQSPPSESMNHS